MKRITKLIITIIIMALGIYVGELLLWYICEIIYNGFIALIYGIGKCSNQWMIWFYNHKIAFTIINFLLINAIIGYVFWDKED